MPSRTRNRGESTRHQVEHCLEESRRCASRCNQARLLQLSVALLVTILVAASRAVGGIYFGPSYTFSAEAPEGWNQVDPDSSAVDACAAFFPGGTEWASAPVTIYIYIADIDSRIVDVESLVEFVLSQSPGLSVHRTGSIPTHGQEAPVYRWENSESGHHEDVAYLVGSGNIAIVALTSEDEGALEENRLAFEEVVEDFQWLPTVTVEAIRPSLLELETTIPDPERRHLAELTIDWIKRNPPESLELRTFVPHMRQVEVIDLDSDGNQEIVVLIEPSLRLTPQILLFQSSGDSVLAVPEAIAPGGFVEASPGQVDTHCADCGLASQGGLGIDLGDREQNDEDQIRILRNSLRASFGYTIPLRHNGFHCDVRLGYHLYAEPDELSRCPAYLNCEGLDLPHVDSIQVGYLEDGELEAAIVAQVGQRIYVYRVDKVDAATGLEKAVSTVLTPREMRSVSRDPGGKLFIQWDGARSTPLGQLLRDPSHRMIVANPKLLDDMPVAFDEPPIPFHQVAADYPESARLGECEGIVEVRTRIASNGNISSASVFRSDADFSLEFAALEAAVQWLFQPARRGGEAVACEIVIPFRFTLD